ncbi:MAG TPA: TadE/TadG family type IV pilus assembly protein [Planctomycetaceae bacterium]|jgi:Flp pilus assembly protein TadG|nr:TadE/TadG family type IV pilus assembly protein [Planctomycetaceae bacterium]
MRTLRPVICGLRPERLGAAATELAIVLPLLVLLTFGCVDMGRSIAAYIIVSNAARVGAEYGATHGYSPLTYASWQNQVITNATQEMQGTGASFDPTRLTLTVTATPTTGNLYRTTVVASYRFDMLTSVPGLPQEFVLTHSVSMDRFR